MMTRTLFVLTLIFSVCLASLRADGSAKFPPSRVVGSVHGKSVTSADIGLTTPIDPAVRFDATDTEDWELMGRVMTAFGGPVLERFVVQRTIEPTADELEAFRTYWKKLGEEAQRELEGRLAKVKAELASRDLPGPVKTKLEKERAELEQRISQTRDGFKFDKLDDFPRDLIVGWKVERELHRKYGGRVIFQQIGLEALDAHRLLFEEAEKKGDLKFADAGVRHLFYYYYANMKHTEVDAKFLEERPWFLGDGR